MKVHRAPALDGRRTGELRFLPDNILDMCARLLNGVEGEWIIWSKVLTMGIASCLPMWEVKTDHAAGVGPDQPALGRGC
eukprot:3753649-Pyramimonas_sp.AAC.1